VVAARISPAVGVVEAIDEHTCVLATGADSVETVAVYAGLLDADFTVTEPPELVERLRMLADRYRRACGAGVGPGALPGAAWGLGLRKTLVRSGLMAVVVPSGLRVRRSSPRKPRCAPWPS
jgi:hypothetical protein